MITPLADKLRPTKLEDVVGQEEILSNNGMLRRIIESKHIPNLIFFGPSGVGKTTVARIIASQTGMLMCKLNGTTCSSQDIRDVMEKRDTLDGRNGILLYLDEIQYLNKKQQQILLEYIEDGSVTLIASTTENPYFYVYNAILSRCTVFEFKPVKESEVEKAVIRAFNEIASDIELEDGVTKAISYSCGGDVRKALNMVEALFYACKNNKITLEDCQNVSQKSALRYDRDGDEHYDIISAYQKSLRGSDENAALHYLGRLLEAGDLISACRRLLVCACEDVGLAYPQIIPIVKAAVDSARELGLPEARIPLSDAVILVCTAPKSNSGVCAIDAALDDIRSGKTGEIPAYLRDSHYDGATKLGHAIGYKYPHSYGGWVEQQYLPDEIKDKKYYVFGNNKNERLAQEYRKIQRESKK